MGLRERKNVDLIACPSCGRAEIDVIEVARQAQEAFGDKEIPLQVAVMGCVVNGPGEARDADIGIAAGKNKGHLFVRGQNVAVVPEDEMVDSLVEWGDLHRRPRRRRRLERARSTSDAARRPPNATGPSCSTSRAPTPTTASNGSRSSASCERRPARLRHLAAGRPRRRQRPPRQRATRSRPSIRG